MTITGIVAVDRAGAIGKAGALPWHYTADLKHFKDLTTGNAIVMGRRTWQSLRRPLPNRLNIVLSRGVSHEPVPGSVLWLREKESVLTLKDYLKGDLFIIGGAQIFELFRQEIDKWIVTEVPMKVEGADTFMPAGYLDGFVASDELRLDEGLLARFYRRL